MTVSDALDQLWDQLEGYPLDQYGLYDDEDLIKFALRYLGANADHALEDIWEDDDDNE